MTEESKPADPVPPIEVASVPESVEPLLVFDESGDGPSEPPRIEPVLSVAVVAPTARPEPTPPPPLASGPPMSSGPPGPPGPSSAPVSPSAPIAPRRTWKQHAWAVLCHLMLFLAIPTIFLGGVVTFFLWQIKGNRDPQVEDQGREALNFQINVAVLTALLSITFFGIALVPLVWLVAGIFCLIAARKAAEGANYRYPYIVRVVTH